MTEIHFFDLDGTLWNIKSNPHIIDKEKPYKSIIKISRNEFSLIKNGVYKQDNIPLEYNGNIFYISKELYKKIYKKTKSENVKRFGISFMEYTDRELLNNSNIEYLLNNINHLRGRKDISMGILTARSNMKNHSDIINNLRLELINIGISIDKNYFIGDKFSFNTIDKQRLQKSHILLEHLIGFKIKYNKFISEKQDWYRKVYFYDDDNRNIHYANDIQRILNELLYNTDDDIFKIIIDRINNNKIILNNNLVTNNDFNRFKTTSIDIVEPEKYPISEKLLHTFESYSIFYNKQEKKEFKTNITNILNGYILEYIFDFKIINFSTTINSNLTEIQISIYAYGQVNLDSNRKQQNYLMKMTFYKNKHNIWLFKYKKSPIYRKIENRKTDKGSSNIVKIKNDILNILNK